MLQFGGLRKHEKSRHALKLQNNLPVDCGHNTEEEEEEEHCAIVTASKSISRFF